LGSSVRLATTCPPSPPKPRTGASSRRGRIPGTPRVLYRKHQQSRSVRSGNPVLCARENMALSAVSAVMSSSWLLQAAAFPKGAFQNDMCWFESSMPNQPVRSLRCNIRACENRRYSRAIGWRAGVSGRQILECQVRTGGFAAPVSARQFPFRPARDRFDVWRRPVFGAHERGRALARPVTVRFAGAVPSTIAAMMPGDSSGASATLLTAMPRRTVRSR
jgi:hypothetical protein